MMRLVTYTPLDERTTCRSRHRQVPGHKNEVIFDTLILLCPPVLSDRRDIVVNAETRTLNTSQVQATPPYESGC